MLDGDRPTQIQPAGRKAMKMKIRSANGLRVLILVSLALGFLLGKRVASTKVTEAK